MGGSLSSSSDADFQAAVRELARRRLGRACNLFDSAVARSRGSKFGLALGSVRGRLPPGYVDADSSSNSLSERFDDTPSTLLTQVTLADRIAVVRGGSSSPSLLSSNTNDNHHHHHPVPDDVNIGSNDVDADLSLEATWARKSANHSLFFGAPPMPSSAGRIPSQSGLESPDGSEEEEEAQTTQAFDAIAPSADQPSVILNSSLRFGASRRLGDDATAGSTRASPRSPLVGGGGPRHVQQLRPDMFQATGDNLAMQDVSVSLPKGTNPPPQALPTSGGGRGAPVGVFAAAFPDVPMAFDDSDLFDIGVAAAPDELPDLVRALALRHRIAVALLQTDYLTLAESEFLLVRSYTKRLLDAHDLFPKAPVAVLELRRLFTETSVGLARVATAQLRGFLQHPDFECMVAAHDLGSPHVSARAVSTPTDGQVPATPSRTPSVVSAATPTRKLDPARRRAILRVGVYHARVAKENAVRHCGGERTATAIAIHMIESDLLAAAGFYSRAVLALQRAIGIGVSLYGGRSWTGESEARRRLEQLKSFTEGQTAPDDGTGRSPRAGDAAAAAAAASPISSLPPGARTPGHVQILGDVESEML